jgi:hypothetical protein
MPVCFLGDYFFKKGSEEKKSSSQNAFGANIIFFRFFGIPESHFKSRPLPEFSYQGSLVSFVPKAGIPA